MLRNILHEFLETNFLESNFLTKNKERVYNERTVLMSWAVYSVVDFSR